MCIKTKLIALLVPVIVFTSFTPKEEYDYSVSAIPESLKHNADAVLRYSNISFTVFSPKKAVYSEKYAITILQKSAYSLSYFVEGYDKSDKITHIRGTLYDKNGKRIKKISASDLLDIPAVSGGTLYADNRLKAYDPECHEFPFTIEFEFERESNGILYYPVWEPQSSYQLSVEKAEFELTYPTELSPRYKNKRISEPEKSTENNQTTLKWAVQDLPCIIREPVSEPLTNLVPVIYTAPDKFEYEKYKGNMESWESIGKWIWELNRDRDQVPPETVAKINQLIDGLETRRERVKAIYEFMQKKTRYVSVQLGIGGYQPYPAGFVDENGYGDCKALSNYMISLLKAVGIESNYVLVRAGKNAAAIQTDFPGIQFNHVIVCVPGKKDSIWLECTDQHMPFGFLGSFTSDRDVLFVVPGGGEIIHTPVYNQQQNFQLRKALITIDDDGKAHGSIVTRFGGLQFENVQGNMELKGSDQVRSLNHILDIPDFKIDDIKYNQLDTCPPVAIQTLDLHIDHAVTLNGKRMFLPLNFMNKKSYIPPMDEERKTRLMLTFAYTDIDTIYYTVPETYKVEAKPDDLVINSEFGQYKTHILIEANHITYIRKVTMVEGEFPPEKYVDFTAFQKKMVKADKQKLVLNNSL